MGGTKSQALDGPLPCGLTRAMWPPGAGLPSRATEPPLVAGVCPEGAEHPGRRRRHVPTSAAGCPPSASPWSPLASSACAWGLSGVPPDRQLPAHERHGSAAPGLLLGRARGAREGAAPRARTPLPLEILQEQFPGSQVRKRRPEGTVFLREHS